MKVVLDEAAQYTLPYRRPKAPRRKLDKRWLPLAGCGLGLVAAGLALYLGQRVGTDAGSYYRGARAVLEGRNPYVWDRTVSDWPSFYPLPTYLVLVPLAVFPLPAFHLLLAGISGGLLGWAGTKRPELAPALLSAGFFGACAVGGWGPVLLAGVALPGLSWVWGLKPSLGLALFTGWPIRRRIPYICMGILGVVSLAVLPSWPRDWLHNLGSANHVAPIFRPGGFLLLLALLRWRDPGARMLAVLALVPHTVSVADAMLGFAVCRNRWEAYGLALASYGAAFWAGAVVDPSMTLVHAQAQQWPAVATLCYLPALVLALRA